MENKNLCVVLRGVKDLQMETRPIPKPKAGEVQIAMRAVSICCSDVHFYNHGRIGDFIVESPMIMGHEGAGVISAVGEDVTNVKVGDRVCVEPGIPCGSCCHCKGGGYNLCPYINFCSTPPIDGLMCRYHVQPAAFVHKIPDNMSWEEGALCEPVTCAVSACRRANVGVGHHVVVFGAGPIGLLVAMVARANGATRIAVVDIAQARLDFAKEALGEDVHLFLSDMKASSKQTADDIVVTAFNCRRPDIAIECSGAEAAMQSAIYATKSGGVVVVVGLGKPSMNLPVIDILCREVDIRGIFRYANTFPVAVSLIGSGEVDAMKLVTHCLPLEEGVQAYELSANPAKSGAVKVIVNCEDGGSC